MVHMIGDDQATLCGQNCGHRYQTVTSEVAFYASVAHCKRCAACLRKRDAQRQRFRAVMRGTGEGNG